MHVIKKMSQVLVIGHNLDNVDWERVISNTHTKNLLVSWNSVCKVTYLWEYPQEKGETCI